MAIIKNSIKRKSDTLRREKIIQNVQLNLQKAEKEYKTKMGSKNEGNK